MAVSWYFIPNVLESLRRIRLVRRSWNHFSQLSGPDAGMADLIRAPTEGCSLQSSMALPSDGLCHLGPSH